MSQEHPNARLEAFSDGVFAIALTLLILDIKIPSPEKITNVNEFWIAIRGLLPSLAAFFVSFTVIFINWVNHHVALKLIQKSSTRFIYANGVLLLAIVVYPFPTALLGEYLTTEFSAPAVVLYSFVSVLASVGWNLIGRAALSATNPLAKSEAAELAIGKAFRQSHYAFVFYGICTLLAFWMPQVVAVIIACTWFVWLIVGVRIKDA